MFWMPPRNIKSMTMLRTFLEDAYVRNSCSNE